ncbi:MAG: hypothetical protein WCY26_07095 [Thiohalobacteraceae bacterium]|nr:hypothetical protein [Gammaproteobacteria bacterium]
MFKLIAVGGGLGLAGLVGLVGQALANAVMGVIGLGVALFLLAIGLEVVAGLVERTARRSNDIR